MMFLFIKQRLLKVQRTDVVILRYLIARLYADIKQN
ncbi:Uncharacterised protein [Vibrio cholerae]|nr:Uncharacterised protein [Vibrio cholerae]